LPAAPPALSAPLFAMTEKPGFRAGPLGRDGTLRRLVVQAVQLAANRPVRIVGGVHVDVEATGMRANLVDQRGIRSRAARRTWRGRRQCDDDRPVYAAVAAMDVSRGRGRD